MFLGELTILTALAKEALDHAHFGVEVIDLGDEYGFGCRGDHGGAPLKFSLVAEDDVLRTHAPIVVLDTDLVSTVVYAEHYYGSVAPWIAREAQLRLGDLYLLCDIDLPWVPDGIRDQPHLRPQIHQLVREQLARWNANVVTVRGVGDARGASALAAVASWRSARAGV